MFSVGEETYKGGRGNHRKGVRGDQTKRLGDKGGVSSKSGGVSFRGCGWEESIVEGGLIVGVVDACV